jgi:uncharacterized membrane protein
MKAALGIALTLGLAVAAGCAERMTIDEHPCPPGGTELTYDNFGEAFLTGWCQTCHGAPDPERHGAPDGYDFGTPEDVRRWRARIFARAAAINTSMPPGPDDPSAEERDMLADWLACGAP